jgi:Na+/H+ antiporter NhaD/arsenite permease-like protein
MSLFQSFLAVAVLLGAYLLIVLDRLEGATAALVGATVLIVAGVLDQREAIGFVDFNTLGLLAGMMLIVSVARKSGVFSYLAIRGVQLVRASPAGVLAIFALITALLSAFVNNVTVVLLVVPVTFVVCDELGVSAYQFLFAEVLASNIGGTATLIGDPPNILIGSATGLGFNAFAWHLAPISIVIMVLQTAAIHILWGRAMKASPESRQRVMSIRAVKAIENRYLLVCSLVVIPAVLAALIAADILRLEPATVALSGAGVLLLLQSVEQPRDARNEQLNHTLRDVEWTMLIFLVGLFVMVGAVQKAGALGVIGKFLLAFSAHSPATAAAIVLWLSAPLSALVDNVPYVAAMIPVIKAIAPALGGSKAVGPVWWALALGAGLGGNGTLIGASANIAVAALAERSGLRFGFMQFALRAFPLMLASIAVAHIYILWRYA